MQKPDTKLKEEHTADEIKRHKADAQPDS